MSGPLSSGTPWCGRALEGLLSWGRGGCSACGVTLGIPQGGSRSPSLTSLLHHSDLLQNPLLVPVKVLKGHVMTLDLGVLDVLFHPTQPWVFSSGADGTVRLYT